MIYNMYFLVEHKSALTMEWTRLDIVFGKQCEQVFNDMHIFLFSIQVRNGGNTSDIKCDQKILSRAGK